MSKRQPQRVLVVRSAIYVVNRPRILSPPNGSCPPSEALHAVTLVSRSLVDYVKPDGHLPMASKMQLRGPFGNPGRRRRVQFIGAPPKLIGVYWFVCTGAGGRRWSSRGFYGSAAHSARSRVFGGSAPKLDCRNSVTESWPLAQRRTPIANLRAH